MIIQIDKETGLPMFPLEQMLAVPALKDCYMRMSLHGLYYTILYGWEGSPYRTKSDPEERNALAYAAVKNIEIYDQVKDKMVKANDKIFANKMYENPFVRVAISTINTLARVPLLEMRYYWLDQIDQLKKEQGKVKYDASKEVQFKSQISTQAIISKTIKEMTAEVESIDKKLSEIFKIEQYVSLNDLITAV